MAHDWKPKLRIFGSLVVVAFLSAGFLVVRQFLLLGVFSPRSTLNMVVGGAGVAAGLWATGLGIANRSTGKFRLGVAAAVSAALMTWLAAADGLASGAKHSVVAVSPALKSKRC